MSKPYVRRNHGPLATRLLAILGERPGLTCAELSMDTGSAWGCVNGALRNLRRMGLVQKSGPHKRVVWSLVGAITPDEAEALQAAYSAARAAYRASVDQPSAAELDGLV